MIIYELPLPPSVNAMYYNRGLKGVAKEARRRGEPGQPIYGRSKTAAYTAWRRQAGLSLMCQGPLKTHDGPCHIRIIISDAACGDLDNRCKAILDFLVTHQIIKDDDKNIVRKILLEWGEVEGARVEISAAPEFVTRRGLAKRESA